MNTQRNISTRLRWLPNILSGSRVVIAVFVYASAINQAWVVAFGLLILALVTDFFDGLAAKKLHAESVLGGHIDRVSDFSLALAGVLGLSIGAGILPLWVVAAGLVVAVYVGYVKFFLPEEGLVRRVTSIFSLALLFFTWTYIAWGFLSQAFGWSWLYPPLTFVLLVTAAAFKRHRLRAWFGWLAPNAGNRFRKS